MFLLKGLFRAVHGADLTNSKEIMHYVMDNPLLRIISSKNKAQLHFFDKGTPRSGLSRSYNGYFCQNMSGMMT